MRIFPLTCICFVVKFVTPFILNNILGSIYGLKLNIKHLFIHTNLGLRLLPHLLKKVTHYLTLKVKLYRTIFDANKPRGFVTRFVKVGSVVLE